MKQQLEKRLEALKSEFESGQKMITDLENQKVNLRDTLLRISGAIQVIEELLAETNMAGENQAQSLDKDAVSLLTN
ncbi:hypothetical protein BJP36_08530 [Moorena producens JHB]|uniref:Uncharacterized protein n=1 Tax=Moorena producens (strain JHB) TaxID=1454205 RepID=A0A1D9FX94_MOOP1|nr:hypothetical protein [Moorena producens]AOY79961.1 hypothetical protein BJP36_08530 [Moorena producens JHB]